MPEKKKKKQKLWVRLSLLLILFSMSFWAYNQFTINYSNIELSNRMIEALLKNKTELAQRYADELGLTKQHLSQTEVFIGKLEEEMGKLEKKAYALREENEQLQLKAKLLDKVSELEKTIANLKEKNSLVMNQMTEVKNDPGYEISRIKTIEDGRKLSSTYRDRLRKIKDRIQGIKRQQHKRKVVLQEERDRIETLVGNNGFMVRSGKACSVIPNFPPDNKDINIDVEFVE